ncbi:MAG: hypothetical protein AB1726_14990 [Planctomycetota bacterium]
MPPPIAFLVLLLLLGCQVTETTQPAPGARVEVRLGAPARAWEVIAGGAVQGEVVLFAAPGAPADSLYVVRDLWQQDRGLVDSRGRAWRFVLHAPDPVWVGTGTVAAGAGRILGLGGECALVEVELEGGPADAPPGSRRAPPPAAPDPGN